MKPIAIIGAGITGLTAAFSLKRLGFPVRVYEASGRVGGVIQSVRENGYLAEFGPNTILETSPRISRLIRDAGLSDRRVDPDLKASNRFVVCGGRPVAMPGTPFGFFASGMFSTAAKLAVLREPFVAARTDGADESIAEFVERRLGREFLDRAIDALVGGIYAGDARKLSVRHAFPRLAQMEARYGSLIKGQILGARDRRKRGEISKDRAPKFSFDEGLQLLPDTLRKELGSAVRLNCPVIKIVREGATWIVHAREDGVETRVEHSAVIYAGSAFRLADLKIRTDHDVSFGIFSEIRYPPVSSVVLGFRREDVSHPLNGFGMLVPRREGFKILGTIFSSSLFPGRAPKGFVTLTTYIGGERQPELASLSPLELYATVYEDLRVLLGVKGRPTFRHRVYYPKAIPQYNIGYSRYRDLMNDIERKAPGLYFAGHYRDGISVSDSIVSGCGIADRVAQALSDDAPRSGEQFNRSAIIA